jgi:hypothetical protein
VCAAKTKSPESFQLFVQPTQQKNRQGHCDGINPSRIWK